MQKNFQCDFEKSKKEEEEEIFVSHTPLVHIGLINFLILKKDVKIEKKANASEKKKRVRSTDIGIREEVLFPEYKFYSLPLIV